MNHSLPRHRLFHRVLLGCLAWTAALAARTAAGSLLTLTEAQRQKLIQLVHDDAGAGALFADVQKAADAALDAKPAPLTAILSEGKLASDPAKIAGKESLGDMAKISALSDAYAVTGKAAYAAKAKEFILAWAGTNHSTGDPINDTKYEPMFVAYDLTRESFSPTERATVEKYFRGIADEEIRSGQGTKHVINNWNSHRLKVEGLIAFAIDDQTMIDSVVAGYKKQVGQNLLPDGTTYDLHQRDAMRYQVYDLEPLLTLAIAARNHGIDLYDYQAPNGASLPKSVAYVIPYANGSQQHVEFVHSKVKFDRERAADGQSQYQAGSIWKPTEGRTMLSLAEAFDPSLLPLVAKLAKNDGGGSEKYPVWQVVINDAERAAAGK